MLFETNIYGPIHSRRLGNSLGINLMLTHAKICTFDCVYCECGFNTASKGEKLPTRQAIYKQLEQKLTSLQQESNTLDVITFSGNGEPTMHPDFPEIIDDTIELRNKYCPYAKITVLSNSTQIHKPEIVAALRRADNCLMKFDSANDYTMHCIDQPQQSFFTVDWLIDNLCKFEGDLTIQTIFIRGEYNGNAFDNTNAKEVENWINALKKIRPKQVMIYAIDRVTPIQSLEKVSVEELKQIAEQVRAEGFDVLVAG